MRMCMCSCVCWECLLAISFCYHFSTDEMFMFHPSMNGSWMNGSKHTYIHISCRESDVEKNGWEKKTSEHTHKIIIHLLLSLARVETQYYELKCRDRVAPFAMKRYTHCWTKSVRRSRICGTWLRAWKKTRIAKQKTHRSVMNSINIIRKFISIAVHCTIRIHMHQLHNVWNKVILNEYKKCKNNNESGVFKTNCERPIAFVFCDQLGSFFLDNFQLNSTSARTQCDLEFFFLTKHCDYTESVRT